MKYLSILLSILICSCSTANNFSITAENDVIGDTDKNYTHGTFFTNSIDYEKAYKPIQNTASILPTIRIFDDDPKKLNRIKLQLGQEMHTPGDITVTELLEDDNPYAGYLFTSITRINSERDFRLQSTLSVGLIGKYSFAEHTQKFVHNDLGMGRDPVGWDNQLPHEPTLNFDYSRIKKFYYGNYFDRVSDITFRLGTVHTDIIYTNLFRAGRNLPELDGSHSDRISAYLFLGPRVSLVGRNIFYDGNLFRDSHSVDTKHFVHGVLGGAGLEYKGYSVKLNTVWSSRQYSEQVDCYSLYGGLVFGVDW
jgi:hypothetical protein